jgi:hypothetical protein
MVIVSLVFLFVYLFGAYAYGAAMLFGLRDVGPVWTHGRDTVLPGQRRIDAATMALFVISTVWFVLHAVIEFRDLTTGDTRQGWLDLATFIVFFFPPVIMHTTYLESEAAHEETPPPLYRTLLRVMYVVSPAAGLYLIGAIFKLLPSPADLGPFIGITIGGLFTLTSIYCTVLMLRRPQRPARSADQIRLRNVMIFLFIMLSGVFIALIFMEESSLLVAILGRVTRSSPIFFLVASVYFENRFVFYDLVVKRATLLLASMLVLGLYVSLTLPWLSQVPAGAARPWLWAVALAPVPMVMRPLVAWLEAWLDRMWLGREFTPVDAVKHVLAAMQPATDEASLVRATEARLSEIFRSRIAVLTGSETAGEAAIELEVAMPTPLSGEPVRIAPHPQRRPGDAALARVGVRLHAREHPIAAAAPGAGPTGARSATAVEPLGAEGLAGADQPALPVQRAQRHCFADSHRSRAGRRGRRTAGRGVPLHAAPLGIGMGAARPGAGLRPRVSRRRAGPVWPAADLQHRLRSSRPGAARAVDADPDAAGKCGEAWRVTGARTWTHRRHRAHHAGSDHDRSS